MGKSKPYAPGTHVVIIPKAYERFIIGIWRFREAGKVGDWMATYCFRGQYYDARGKATPQSAIDAIVEGIQKLRGK